MVRGSFRFQLRHRAGDTWHPLEEASEPQPAPAGTDRPERDKGRVFRCDECDLEVVVGDLWQEGTMDW